MKTAVVLLAVSALASAQSAAGPWARCGGIGYTGPTTCVAGWTCVRSNDWYSQCLQGAVTSTPPAPTTTSPPTVPPTTTSSPAAPSSTASDDDGCPAVPN